MNQFDHAIVYLPPTSAGDKAIWIDATAEFTRVGGLPYGDQGRLALIISEKTTDLTLTPRPAPEDSVLIETREYNLADFGPSNVIESSQTTGYADATYRSEFGGSESKELKTSIENYAKNAYLAKSLSKMEHGDAKDFTKPFSLRLEITGANVATQELMTLPSQRSQLAL